LQRVGGERIVDRVARVLRSTTDRLIIVSDDPDATHWIAGAAVVGDVLPGRASLIGIHAALVHAGSGVIVVAWDMPFVPEALLADLRQRLRPGVSAAIPTGDDGPEPACAAYAAEALPHIERLVAIGAFKMQALVDELPKVDIVPEKETSRFGDARTMFMNVNRPEDLKRAEEIAANALLQTSSTDLRRELRRLCLRPDTDSLGRHSARRCEVAATLDRLGGQRA
jgi:molybdopterin-guanine dinucleotide biosynthesis protein A